MLNFHVAVFSVIICCLVKLNGSKEISKSFLTSEQDAEEIPAAENLRILENSDSNPEDADANSEDEFHKIATSSKSDQEPEQAEFSSRVEREKNKIDYSECGLDMDSLAFGGGSTSNSRVWPWMGALRIKGKNEIWCGSTIINKRFVMTSVPCVTDSNRRTKKPDKVILTFGSEDGKGGDEAEEFGVRSIYVHPKHTPNFDYDVALLELKKPITFNRYIRPICLPPTVIPADSNLYKPQSTGLGLGWGGESLYALQNGPNEKSTLKEVELIIQHPDVCRQSLRTEKMRAYFTDRMFCAAEKGPYLCMGDSGGPVMQSQVRADGHRFWTQVGIISFGEICGPNTNGFHSNVHKLLPWILSIAE